MGRRTIVIIALVLLLLVGVFVLAGYVKQGGFSVSRIGNFRADSLDIKPRTIDSVKSSASTDKNTNPKQNKSAKPNGQASKTANETKTANEAKAVPVLCEAKNQVPQTGPVIINEVAWMGTLKSYANEWIELKSMSSSTVDLVGWQLQNRSQKIKIFFPTDSAVLPGGFFVMERTDDDTVPESTANLIYTGNLGNQKDGLFLFDQNCILRDTANATSTWPGGDNVSKKTMERAANLLWHTSKNPGGTPGSEND